MLILIQVVALVVVLLIATFGMLELLLPEIVPARTRGHLKVFLILGVCVLWLLIGMEALS